MSDRMIGLLIGGFGAAVGINLAGLAAWLLLGAFRELRMAQAARRWPVARGVVLESRVVDEDLGGDGGILFRPEVVYVYTVDGKEFEGRRAALRLGDCGPQRAEKAVADYPPGRTVEVRYDPAAPGESVLDLGGGWLLASGKFFVIGGFVIPGAAAFAYIGVAFIGAALGLWGTDRLVFFCRGDLPMQITINAFATLEEIADWLMPFAAKMPLSLVLKIYFQKPRFVPIKLDQFVDKARTLQANELWIDLVPITTLRGKLDPKYKNRERFFIYLPQMTKSGLREGNFGTVATKEKHLKVWRSIIRAIRKNSTGGMWIWNNLRMTKHFCDRSRYSPKIAELHAKGLQLRPFAGDNDLFIHEPNADGEPGG